MRYLFLLLITACLNGCATFTDPQKSCAALCKMDKVEHYYSGDGEQCVCRSKYE